MRTSRTILNNNGENNGQSTLFLCTYFPTEKILFQQETRLKGSRELKYPLFFPNLESDGLEVYVTWCRQLTLKLLDWIIKSGTLLVLSAKICWETKLNSPIASRRAIVPRIQKIQNSFDNLIDEIILYFSSASQRSWILDPWIWLAKWSSALQRFGYMGLYWPSERSRWLDIGRILFLGVYGPRLYLIIWLAPWAGKMNHIARCDWLPERAWWSYLAAATKLFGTSHRIGWEDDIQTMVTMDPIPKTIELRANKIQWN